MKSLELNLKYKNKYLQISCDGGAATENQQEQK